MTTKFTIIIHNTSSFAATLALLLAAIGRSDMSLWYIFVIHDRVGMHQSEVHELWIQHSVCGDDPSIQQSSHAAVYMLVVLVQHVEFARGLASC